MSCEEGIEMTEKPMINVTKITKTCSACPAQWEGWTDDNRQIYVRYRWGHLTVELGEIGDKAEMAAVDGEEVLSYHKDNHPYGGYMEYDELKQITKDVISFPEEDHD